MRDKRKLVLLIVLLLLIIALFLPIKLTYKIKALGRIQPEQEWYFMRSQDDSYLSEMFDYENNAISNMVSYKFERGDIATVKLLDKLKTGIEITKGDTIGYIHSYLIDNNIEKIKSQITTNEALMLAEGSGSKQSEIDSYYQKLLFARQALDLEKKNFERITQLFNDSIIAKVKFEEAENKYKLAEIEVSRVEYDFKSAKSGEKPSEINFYKEQLNALISELELLENLKSQYYIISPIDGIIFMNQNDEKIFSVSKLADFIVEIPVKAGERIYLNQVSSIQIPDIESEAEFININYQATHIENRQILLIKARVSNSENKLMPGMFAKVDIFCDKVSILTYLKRNIF